VIRYPSPSRGGSNLLTRSGPARGNLAHYKKQNNMTTETENTQEKAVDAILEKHGISYAVTYSGEAVERDGKKEWKHDAWRVSFGSWGNVFSTDYKTGTGLRKMNKKGDMKPVFPKAAGVLYSLIMDGEALDQSFYDWCACFGYDEDSRKAEAIYFACCENGKNIRKTFSREAVEEIKEALQDY